MCREMCWGSWTNLSANFQIHLRRIYPHDSRHSDGRSLLPLSLSGRSCTTRTHRRASVRRFCTICLKNRAFEAAPLEVLRAGTAAVGRCADRTHRADQRLAGEDGASGLQGTARRNSGRLLLPTGTCCVCRCCTPGVFRLCPRNLFFSCGVRWGYVDPSIPSVCTHTFMSSPQQHQRVAQRRANGLAMSKERNITVAAIACY